MSWIDTFHNASPRLSALVIGDVMLDCYVTGEVARISPEAPVPVLREARSSYALGGAANVAANLRAFGVDVVLAGAVGNDGASRTVRSLCASHEIQTQLLTSQSSTVTKTRYVTQGQHMLRVDREEVLEVEEPARDAWTRDLVGALASYDVIVLSDYQKGLLSDDLLATVIAAASSAKVPVVVDPKGGAPRRYRGATVLTPNLKELRELVGIDTVPATREQAVRALLEETDAEAVILTCGAEGLLVAPSGEAFTSVRATAREVFDVTGAGDTVVAALAMGLGLKGPWVEVAEFANRAAGYVVGRVGTATVEPHALSEVLGDGLDSPLSSRPKLESVLAETRERGSRVVFTNGCFDILHPGHVHLLAEAKALGDVLVVGINSDDSVRRLKGEGRPALPLEDRAALLLGLRSVDYVASFEEDTPESIVGWVQPDVLVKGADYSDKAVVGREFVEERGGEVVLIPLLEGQSTTRIRSRVADGSSI